MDINQATRSMGGMTVRQRPSRWEWDRIKVLWNNIAGWTRVTQTIFQGWSSLLHHAGRHPMRPLCPLHERHRWRGWLIVNDYILLPFNWHNASLSGKTGSYSWGIQAKGVGILQESHLKVWTRHILFLLVLQSKLIRLMVKYLKPFGVQQEYEMNMHGVWEAVKVSLQTFI